MILIDTVAFIRHACGQPMPAAARDAIRVAEDQGGLFLSVVSLWEIETLARKTGRTSAIFGEDPKRWLSDCLAVIPVIVTAFDAEDALALFDLPPMHNDPADRMLVATARRRDLPLVTSDEKILALAESGHVQAIAC
jgi:PIN domain nuclease of toxin-antitoxin system